MEYERGQTKGYDLHFDTSSRERRLRVGCLWPAAIGNGYSNYSLQDSKVITVAVTRSAEAIAKDILRRLGAWYDEQYDLMCLARFSREVEIDERTALADRWLAIMGPAARSNDRQHWDNHEIELHCGGVDVKIHDSEKATLHIGYDRIPLIEAVLKALGAQRVFVPPCEGEDWEGDEKTPCTLDGTVPFDTHWRRQWYCPRHHAVAVAHAEMLEQERLVRRAIHEAKQEDEPEEEEITA
jgi:hypothetical protein